jgi:hypothetical protein
MVGDVETYFSLLNNYRNGDVDPFVLCGKVSDARFPSRQRIGRGSR